MDLETAQQELLDKLDDIRRAHEEGNRKATELVDGLNDLAAKVNNLAESFATQLPEVDVRLAALEAQLAELKER